MDEDETMVGTASVKELYERYKDEFHPYANVFPMMEQAEFDELVADIREHGLRERIAYYHGKVLDGRNRYLAYIAAKGEKPQYWHNDYFYNYRSDEQALAGVVSLNLKRRHLTQSQRADLAVELEKQFAAIAAKHKGGRPAKGGAEKGEVKSPQVSQATKERTPQARKLAAAAVGVGEQLVSREKKVAQERPDLAERVRAGELTVNAAYEQVTGKTREAKATCGDVPGDGEQADVPAARAPRRYGVSDEEALRQAREQATEHFHLGVSAANGYFTSTEEEVVDILLRDIDFAQFDDTPDKVGRAGRILTMLADRMSEPEPQPAPAVTSTYADSIARNRAIYVKLLEIVGIAREWQTVLKRKGIHEAVYGNSLRETIDCREYISQMERDIKSLLLYADEMMPPDKYLPRDTQQIA